MKSRTMIAMVAVLAATCTFAAPRGRGPGGHRPGPVVVHRGGGHHHHSVWGRGGSHFWPNFVGGVVGGVIADTILPRPAPVVVTSPVVAAPVVTPAPVVVQPAPVVVQPAPVVVQQPAPVVVQPQTVWVEGRYVDQVQPNGAVVRVWQPGHYEQR